MSKKEHITHPILLYIPSANVPLYMYINTYTVKSRTVCLQKAFFLSGSLSSSCSGEKLPMKAMDRWEIKKWTISREKACVLSLRRSPIQSVVYSHREWLEA